jgi:hypothetical protein
MFVIRIEQEPAIVSPGCTASYWVQISRIVVDQLSSGICHWGVALNPRVDRDVLGWLLNVSWESAGFARCPGDAVTIRWRC